MTEVPEYLFERSRQRRIALGLLTDDGGSGGGDAGGGGGGAVATADAGPSTADLVAQAKAAAKLEVEPEAPADPEWVVAANSRARMPYWVLPIMFFLPLWAFVYVKLTEPPPEPISSATEGAQVYASNCASCHGGDGAGGTGRQLSNGEVLLTFPSFDDSMIEWIEIGTAGLGEGTPYGDPGRPGGQRIAGSFGAMPGFGGEGGTLNDHQIYAVIRYIRENVSGEEITADEAAAREQTWIDLGGGAAADEGGGGH